MNIQHTKTLLSIPPSVSELNDQRRASWLNSAYSDSVWSITSSHGRKSTQTIDFQFTLADGRSLVDTARLYATVKEYAWWLRDPRYSRIDSAGRHKVMVGNLMKFAHALTLRNIKSFSHIQPYEIQVLVEDCCYGTDAVLHAFDRVDAYLNDLQASSEIDSKPYGGLPEYVDSSSGVRTGVVHTTRILSACNLPFAASKLPRVSARIAQAASLNGLKHPSTSKRVDGEIPMLRNQKIQTIQAWLDPLEQLYAMRRKIKAEAITFKPFPYGSARVAAVKGVECEHTPIPPPTVILHLLEHSARWIFDHKSVRKKPLTVHNDVLLLTTACWILIAAFTARRAGEIEELCEGCLRGDDDSDWFLNIYIEKTLQRKDWIPVPFLVAKAVETMHSISAEVRQDTESNWLFQWRDPDGKTVMLDVTRKLDDFAATVKVPLHNIKGEEPKPWHWSPHQFRRFFAVLYFYRFEGASIEVLSHHLRHFDLETTKHYITQDAEVAALWTDVEWGYTGHMARSIVAGERSVSGAMGARLKKTTRRLVQAFRQKLQISSVKRLAASLTTLMQRKGLVLTPKPWVTCSCPLTHDAASKAACRRNATLDASSVGPDFASADPTVCCNCRHAIIEGSRKPFIDAEVTHLDAAVLSRAREDTLFGNLERERVASLSHVRDTSYKLAKPVDFTKLDEKKS